MSTSRLFNMFSLVMALALVMASVLAVREVLARKAVVAQADRKYDPIDLAGSDYFQRHPELGRPVNPNELSDYFQRHPQAVIRVNAMAGSWRDPLVNECFDMPLREVARCHEATRTPVENTANRVRPHRNPLDECFDVPLGDVARCDN